MNLFDSATHWIRPQSLFPLTFCIPKFPDRRQRMEDEEIQHQLFLNDTLKKQSFPDATYQDFQKFNLYSMLTAKKHNHRNIWPTQILYNSKDKSFWFLWESLSNVLNCKKGSKNVQVWEKWESVACTNISLLKFPPSRGNYKNVNKLIIKYQFFFVHSHGRP